MNIGEEIREVTFEPIPEGAPIIEPSVPSSPQEPVREGEPDLVPV